MKQYLILLSLIFFGTIICYSQSNKNIIVSKAFIFQQQSSIKFEVKNVKQIKSNKNDKILFYVNELQPDGYIVVTSDLNLPPVIAYSFTDNFGECNINNPLYCLLTTDIQLRIDNIDKLSEKTIENNKKLWNQYLNNSKSELDINTPQYWPPQGTTSTGGWLETNWTQNAPYYNFCPMDTNTNARSLAGCPAVAMAQILNYHKTTNTTHFINSDDYLMNYSGMQYWIDNDYLTFGFPSFPQLNDFLDTLNVHYQNNIILTNNDKAAIIFGCGVAAKQVYTSSGSGTFQVSQAYDAYLRFNCNSSFLIYPTDTSLFTHMKQNIKDSLPVHLAVVTPPNDAGHNVVVDGYNSNDYYHLNFGWGGTSNGWYLVPSGLPYNLTVIEGVILDIMKVCSSGINQIQNKEYNLNVYPNPFENNFTINYELTEKSSVEIEIFNSLGQKVYCIPNKYQISGKYSCEISLNNSPDGIYYCILKNGNQLYKTKIVKQD